MVCNNITRDGTPSVDQQNAPNEKTPSEKVTAKSTERKRTERKRTEIHLSENAPDLFKRKKIVKKLFSQKKPNNCNVIWWDILLIISGFLFQSI